MPISAIVASIFLSVFIFAKGFLIMSKPLCFLVCFPCCIMAKSGQSVIMRVNLVINAVILGLIGQNSGVGTDSAYIYHVRGSKPNGRMTDENT